MFTFAFHKSTVLADARAQTRARARTAARVGVGAEASMPPVPSPVTTPVAPVAPVASTAVTPPVASLPPMTVTFIPEEKWYVHDAKVLGFGVALPILIGGFFGTFGLYFGVAIAANVLGQDLYETSIRPRAQGVVA